MSPQEPAATPLSALTDRVLELGTLFGTDGTRLEQRCLELPRPADALGHVQRHLLWMARLAEDATGHWLTPSRAAERELSAVTVAGLTGAAGSADEVVLRRALSVALAEGRRHWETLAARYDAFVSVPRVLLDEIAATFERAS